MAEEDLYDSTVMSIPRHFTLNNYERANKLLEYRATMGQTLLVVIVAAVLQTASCTLTAYGFARHKFPLKNVLFLCVLLLIVVPPQTILAPLYLNFRFFDIFGLFRLIKGDTLNLLSSPAGYFMLSATCMGLKNGLYIFMLSQYFRGVPKELEEAAWVDGCGKLGTFVRIILPDSAPMLTSCFLFSFVWQWTDSLYASFFLNNLKMFSNQLGVLGDRIITDSVDYSHGIAEVMVTSTTYRNCIVATGMLMCLAPLIILYLLTQRYFVKSLSATGIKM
jgi:multiple sugar transport system permease protein